MVIRIVFICWFVVKFVGMVVVFRMLFLWMFLFGLKYVILLLMLWVLIMDILWLKLINFFRIEGVLVIFVRVLLVLLGVFRWVWFLLL